MSDRPQFGLFPNLYLGVFVGLLLAAPFLLLAPWRSGSSLAWGASASGALLTALLLWLSNRQCSSHLVSYREGLLFVTESMMTGWSLLSAVFVFPALLIAAMASCAISAIYLPLGGKAKSAPAFYRVVKFFHSHRMLQ
ncbi:hypothetical protein GCM10027431_27040 [Lysobacter rhizosphaerae]